MNSQLLKVIYNVIRHCEAEHSNNPSLREVSVANDDYVLASAASCEKYNKQITALKGRKQKTNLIDT
ncbi:MAG: hypothetical protein LBH30_00375 [Prevotellaceae bacterium]|jgi:hypothetical protein|nr:hypothetical protein [Prevotellaceae bacterium]